MSARQEAEKLTATWINNLSVAVLIAGLISPVSGLKEAISKNEVGYLYAMSCLTWFIAGYLVHYSGRLWLEWRYDE